MSLEIRASDEDRQRIVAVLQRHTEAGRLTIDEFSERVAAAYAARTLGDLATVTGDLPVESVPDTGAPAQPARRELLAVFAVAIVTLVLLMVFMSVSRGG